LQDTTICRSVILAPLVFNMSDQELQATKADVIHAENNAFNPYAILTDEELQFMQSFEGRKEKVVIRKVSQQREGKEGLQCELK
jgi:hypothetical protein